MPTDLYLAVADWALKSSALFAAAGVLVLLLRRAAASVRHLVWGLALGGALAVPALSVVAPAWRAPVRLTGVESAVITWSTAPDAPVASPRAASRAGAEARIAAASPATGEADRASAGPAPSLVQPPRSSPVNPSLTTNPPEVHLSIGRLAVVAWLSGLGLVMLMLFVAVWRVRSLRAGARRLESAQVGRLLEEASSLLGLARPVAVLEAERAAMPMTWGARRPIVLLPVAARSWSVDRVRAVLLHELAHVKRYDCVTQLLARVACAVYWFNPLVWMAARQLRVERELACDDLVLAAGSRASDYAGHLLEIARSLRVSAVAGFASVAMARPSQLAGRLLAVLDTKRARTVMTARLAWPLGAAALVVTVPLAGAQVWNGPEMRAAGAPSSRDSGEQATPRRTRAGPSHARAEATGRSAGFAGPPPASTVVTGASHGSIDASASTEVRVVPSSVAEPGLLGRMSDLLRLPVVQGALEAPVPFLRSRLAAQSAQACDWADRSAKNRSSSFSNSDDRFKVRLIRGDCSLNVDARGHISYSPNYDDVVGLSRGGYFDIEERSGRAVRRMELSPSNGTITRRWLVDGVEQTVDDRARAWLAETLLVLFRQGGLDAKGRAQHILDTGGPTGLLDEIGFITSDYVARQYYGVLLTSPSLDNATLQRAVAQAGRTIHSDFELAELLVAVAKEQPLDDAVREAYVGAVGSIGSDFERHRALKAILGRDNLSQALAAQVLELAGGIGSDFERAQLLLEVSEAHSIDATLAPAFFQAVNGIGSSFERSRVLKAVSHQAGQDQQILDAAFASAEDIGSDFELAEVLIELAKQYPPTTPLPPSYLRAAAKIGSSFELRRVLATVVGRDQLSPAVVASVLQAAQNIGSDFEQAELLVSIAQRYDMDDTVRPAFFRALAGVGSDFECGRVLKTVVERASLAEPTVLAVLTASKQIHSDHELAEVLIATARAYKIADALRPTFLDVQ